VEGHQPAQRRQIAVGIGHYLAAAVEQVLADTEQQGAEDGLLAGEVTVDRRSADAGRGPEILQGNAVEALQGKERSGGGQEGLPPVRLRLAGWVEAAWADGSWAVWLGSVTGASPRCKMIPVLDITVNRD
jgi:hypothetical protein